ncbi:pyridoxal-dependent decarboxylase [Actinomadura rubrisoli]|uniref:Histidine decarboxylase n=1 Tax=Actinomadura rubrisoli TaxID=2530368 RepID=A0A4R5BD59_9ACTN|nr:pyridoxal-dependent decarboxylase [Actinomadura rubrisoli]TDD82686.1 histidine decarboxylase [Actinomadura rubrisoli]
MTPPAPVTDEDFRLGDDAFSDQARRAVLDRLGDHLETQSRRFLGYQANQSITGTEPLARFLSLHLNNAGDPFVENTVTTHTRWLERAVLDYYARLWHARVPADRTRARADDYWGYVLSMGSTEGNLYALWSARDYLDGNALVGDEESSSRTTYIKAAHPDDGPNAYTPVAFFSEDTHYSHLKGMRVLDIPTFYDLGADRYPGQCPIRVAGRSSKGWPIGVPSAGGDDGPGAVDVDALARLVEFFAAKGHPALICFNAGSTFKGACDDVAGACARLRPIFARYGLDRRKVHFDPDDPEAHDVRQGFWVHVDAALGGTYLPYLEQAHRAGMLHSGPPVFDFRVPEVASIVTSGHKYPGSPVPTGLLLMKSGHQLRPPSDPAVISSPDTTFAGSRSGLACVILWNHLAQHSTCDHLRTAVRAVGLADYAAARLRVLSDELAARGEPGAEDGIHVGHTEQSLSVWFRRPCRELVMKYSLACVPFNRGGTRVDVSHIYVMPHVTAQLINDLVADLSRPGAFDRSCD